MKSTDGFARCTNAILKPSLDHIGSLTKKQLDRLPRERCARPMLPIYAEDGYNLIGEFCLHCDGPLHTHMRGPQALAEYHQRRQAANDN